MGLSQLGGTSYSRFTTKQNMAGEQALTVSFAPGNNVYSTWIQVTGSTGAEYYIVGISGFYSNMTDGGALPPITIDIGYGGSGSETALASGVVLMGSSPHYIGSSTTLHGLGGRVNLPAPMRLASGQRLALRANMGSNTNNNLVAFYVHVVPYANVEGN